MFLRLLLLLLLALNLGVGGWLLFGHPARSWPPPTDPGVPELQLLSQQAPGPGQGGASAHAVEGSGQCLRIGPFTTRAGMHKAFEALSPQVAGIQFHERDVTRHTG